ncbi:MAG: PKD domain-containing protein [Bacteroidetes bacterium]|nr:MAG: PKD domain-containing protein [Bacteroidota bacterium]
MNISISTKTVFSMQKVSLFRSLALAFAAIPFASFGEAPNIAFEANKNQWPEQVKFKADIPGGHLFLEQNTLTYLYKENISWNHGVGNDRSVPPTKQKMHTFRVHFENSNLNADISGNNRYSWHRNYYLGNDQSKWASNVPVYSQVYYKDLYDEIDMQVYNVENNLKYDIIVHSGGNVKNIKLRYDGTDGMRIENGHLFIKTSVYDLIEQKPYAYQNVNGMKKQIECAYVLNSNKLGFEVGDYDHSLPLIIDPLIASTYSGSTADNWGFTATYDAGTNIYMGGIAAGTGYPTTVGAHDQIFNGGPSPYYDNTSVATILATYEQYPFDIVLTKFDPLGTIQLFSTYYGGSEMEQPHSLVVNSNNELFVVGRTNSPIGGATGFPTTVPNSGPCGGYDIIVGKFNGTGGLMASARIGGTSDDGVNFNRYWDSFTINGTQYVNYGNTKWNYADDGRSEIIIDALGNVCVAGCTQSANFPVSVNAYDNSLSGPQDAVVIKMNPYLTALSFSTYLGGSGYDAGYGLKTDNSNIIYVTGGTTSGDFPIPVTPVWKQNFGGVTDGFIAVFDPSLANAAQLLRSTYLGTTEYDQSYMIEVDASGDLYVYGQTQGAYPVSAGVFSNPNSGQFIHKLSGSLVSTRFSTVIGSGASGGFPVLNISPTAFLVDSCQTIYIAGWGRCGTRNLFPASVIGMPVTPLTAYQSTSVSGCNFYFGVLEPDAKGLFFGTFFGENTAGAGDHVDGGTSRFDKKGVIYHACCASCGGTQGWPTTPGAFSATNKSNHINYNPGNIYESGANCNEAVVKMDVSVNPIAKANITGATKGCAPFVVNFNNSGSNADDFIWDFGDGGTSTSPSPSYTYNFAGTFTITLYAIDSIGICGYIDTSIIIVTVGQYPILITSATNILCAPGVGTATVSPSGGIVPYTYAWSPIGGNAGIATGLTGGNYTVSVTDATGCTATQSVTITEPPALTISTTTVGATCGVSNGSATATAGGGSPGYSYSWSSGQTTSSATGLASGTYSITVTDVNGCTQVQPFVIPVTNSPTITATVTNSVTCNGGSNGAASASLNGGTPPFTYVWSPTSAGTNQTAAGLSAGTYVIIITDATGCSTQTSVTISEPAPLGISIPSTPVSCFNGNNGSATANVTGGTPNYNYSWSPPGGNAATANNLVAGNYTITVTDANGCTKTGSVTITQPASGLALATSTSGSSCGTNANGVASVTVTPNTGTPPYTYNWSNGGTTPVISNIAGGIHTIIVTDANGCTAAGTANMPTSIQPIADFTSTPSITCEGVAYQFTSTSTNATTYYWNIPGVGTSTIQNPGFVFPYNGAYTVTLVVTNPPCKDTVSKPVVIGDLGTGITFKEANVFTPNNDGTNDCFHPAMINSATGLPDVLLLPCTYLEVFDRWGVKMYESIGANGTNCWNGNNKNDSKPAQDGTYFYIAKLGKTTLKGYVTLARHK